MRLPRRMISRWRTYKYHRSQLEKFVDYERGTVKNFMKDYGKGKRWTMMGDDVGLRLGKD